MQKKNILISALLLLVAYFGYLIVNHDNGAEETVAESIILAVNKNYETKALRAKRGIVEDLHAANLRHMWNRNYDVLKKNYSTSFVLFGENGTIDFIAELEKDSANPIFNKDVQNLFNFKSIKTYNYREMIKEGLAEELGASFIQEGDFFAIIQPNENSPDKDKLESHNALYRYMDGKWIAIGGLL